MLNPGLGLFVWVERVIRDTKREYPFGTRDPFHTRVLMKLVCLFGCLGIEGELFSVLL